MTPENVLFSEPMAISLTTRSGNLAEISNDRRIKYASSLINLSVTTENLVANVSSSLTIKFESFMKNPINLRI